MIKDSRNYEMRYFSRGFNSDDDVSIGFFFLAFFTLIGFVIALNVASFFNVWTILFLIATIVLVATGICWLRFVSFADCFDYTVILKENCFTIEGKPKAPWHAWPLDCTYEFDTRNLQVTIYDKVGNHQTYLYNDDLKKFLEEIQKN